MRVLLDKRTIDYMVRLEGAVDFSPAQDSSQVTPCRDCVVSKGRSGLEV